MAVALSFVEPPIVGERVTQRIVKIVFSGSYTAYSAPNTGEAIDLTTITNAGGFDGAKQFSQLPVAIYELAGSGGYYFEIIPQPTPANQTLKNYYIRVYNGGGTELSTTTYPAPVSAPASPFLFGFDTITGK